MTKKILKLAIMGFIIISFTGCVSSTLMIKSYKNSFYKDNNVKIAIKNISVYKAYNRFHTKIVLNVVSLNEMKIIHFKTHTVWGYTYGSDIGGRSVKSGLILYDSLNNDLKITSLKPSFTGYYKEKGLRPHEQQEFTIIANEFPLQKSKYIKFRIPSNTFGNISSFEMIIPLNLIQQENNK